MGSVRTDQASVTLITTIPILVNFFDERKRELGSLCQDAMNFDNTHNHLRSYRILGRVASYNSSSGNLRVQDYSELDGDQLAKPQTQEITVSTDLLTGDGEGLSTECARKGEWIHILGSLELDRESIVLRASAVWHCPHLAASDARQMIWKLAACV
ncbi:hypothetical protein V1512DRAFT_266228 [Lipomyces arxii]|uniref:uncharacterized protein n=1 Tax=Lipomyces arxii TaxID=56418 RepID=UPI0034CFCABC